MATAFRHKQRVAVSKFRRNCDTMDQWTAVWKALCIAWQQGPLQNVIDCFQVDSSLGLSEAAQDSFCRAMSLYATFIMALSHRRNGC